MGKRKPAIMLTAGTLAVATLLSVGVTANAIENIPTPTATQSESRTASIYPEGAWISVDGEWLESFDPSDGLDDEDTGVVDSAVWNVKGGSIQLHDLPAGWTVGTQMRVNQLTGEWSAFYLVEDETKTYRYYWYFDGADGITHTVDEMRGFTLTLNGEPVDCDPTGDVDVHEVYPSDYVGYEGAPANWTVVQRDFTENGVDGYEYVAYPTDTETPVITYRFWYDAPSSADELEGITAILSDGTPVTGFDPTVSGTFDIPRGYDVELRNVPGGWTVDARKKPNGSWDIQLEKGNGEQYFNYLFAVTDSYTWTYTVDQLQNVNATLPDGTPIDGFGWRGGRWTLPKGTTGVNLTGVPDGWNRDVTHEGDTWTVTVGSPDGSISVDYIFDVPHTYTASELSGITATADGTPVDGFTPTQSGTWTVPHGSTVSIKGIPDDWVTVHEDGTLTWTLAAPDNTVSVTYTFEYAAKPASRDDLRTVTATADGEPVENFDPVNGGTFTVPAGTTSVDLAGIPEGWSSTPLTDGRLGFTLASDDGTLTVEYVFVPETVTHTVTFDTGDGTPVDPQTVNHGEQAIDPGTPTRDGYAFTGWLLDGEPYDFATPVTGDVTLVAGWKETPDPTPVTHTVTLDAGNGSQPVRVMVVDGEPVGRPADPTRDGYAFKGWTLDGQPYDFAQPVTGDITLTAQWQKPAEYTVTFDTQGGTPVASQTVTENGTVTRPSDPTRDGYTFKGWTLDGQPYDFGTPVTGNLTLTAVWEENTPPAPVMHKVTVKPNNGSNPTVYEVEDGQPFTQPADPTRDGYTFNGWTLDGEPYDFSQPVTGDITLEAQWEKSETPAPVTHTVKFRTNGGSSIPMQTVEDGRTVGRPTDPTRPGHTFAGWLLDGRPYDFSTPVTGDIILDAAWEETPASDPLSGVTATVDDEPLDGFDPTKDGEYHVDADADVRLSGLPEGWTATRRDTETGFSFTLTDGERTVTYTFITDGAGEPEEPETPDTPQTPDADDEPDTPSDGRETPDADPTPGSDAGDGLASTGVSPAGPLAAMIALLGMALAVLRGRVRR